MPSGSALLKMGTWQPIWRCSSDRRSQTTQEPVSCVHHFGGHTLSGKVSVGASFNIMSRLHDCPVAHSRRLACENPRANISSHLDTGANENIPSASVSERLKRVCFNSERYLRSSTARCGIAVPVMSSTWPETRVSAAITRFGRTLTSSHS